MLSVKGAWVGQTFAVAKGNESNGRKSRIRRSKEERKEMVESFIKTYQLANNGSFPSLNLTHKEVGGSFYTVREIVREIIQENRVLGPGKLTPEELDRPDQFFSDKYPLVSISVEPEIVLPIQPNGSHVIPDHCEDKLGESISNGLPVGSEHQKFDDRSVINGSQVMKNETNKAKTVAIEVGVSEHLVGQKHGKAVDAPSAVSQITADVIVETFPVRPVRKLIGSMEGSSSEVLKSDESLKQTDIGKLDYIVENSVDLSDGLDNSNDSRLESERGEAKVEDLLLKEYNSVDNKVENLLELPQEISDHLVKPTVEQENNNSEALRIGMSHQDILTSQSDKSSGTIAREVPSSPEIIQKHPNAVTNSHQVVNRKEERVGNKTLDGTSRESREAAMKAKSPAPAQPESNPLWAIFESLVAAFVKFWSE